MPVNEFKQINHSTDAIGTVLIPQLHDAELFKLTLHRAKPSSDLMVEFFTEAGEWFGLSLKRVSSLKTDGFTVQNIVFNVIVITSKESIELLRENKNSIYKNSEADLIGLADQIRSGRRSIVIISSSVGCELFCVCESVEFLAKR